VTAMLRMLLLTVSFAVTSAFAVGFDEDYETKEWREMEVMMPAAPQKETLLPFYVSAASDNRFSVDGATLSVGADGVVRYVLVVETAGGARNVSYEGMRCETRERRIYASGRRDGSWSKSRNNAWERIRDTGTNRQHAALFLEFFCPGGVIVRDVAEATNALKQGVHPMNRRW
jgi:hypothetical protein